MWFKVDDQLALHMKALKAGNQALGLWVRAGSWAGAQLTDGYVPDSVIKALDGTKTDTAKLVNAGLWDRVEGGYQFHEWHEYQPTRAEVMASRDASKRRRTLNNSPEFRRTIQERDGDACRYCGKIVDWKDRRSKDGGTYDHVLPLSQGGDESIENIVVACRDCNNRKGARTPDQAGMPLLGSS